MKFISFVQQIMPHALSLGCLASLALTTAPAKAKEQPWDIRAVVLTTYEIGEDTGDRAGEFQPWIEGEHLTEKVPFPLGIHPIYTDAQHHLLVVVTGTPIAPATTSVMALATDPRFDLRHAYWMVDGISGFDPTVASVGSVSIADYVAGDITRYIDKREAPKEWPYGYFMITAQKPNQYALSGGDAPDGSIQHNNAFQLNPSLVHWAYDLTQTVTLSDPPQLEAQRKLYKPTDIAAGRPAVVTGGDFGSDTFWHGKIMTGFARDWVHLLTQGKSHFVSSDMEDSGILEALTRLGQAGRVDSSRVLVLRSASNYTEQPHGMTAVQSMNSGYDGEKIALDNGYRVGSRIIHELLQHWDKFGTQTP